MNIDQIQKAGDELHGRYSWNFANFPRGTRSPDELDELSSAMSALISQASAAGADALVETFRERRKLYQTEKREVIAVREAHPHAVASSFVFLDVRARHHMYLRNFAGEERASRDIAALKEAHEELGAIHGELTTLIGEDSAQPFDSYIEEAERVRKMFQEEISAIEKSRTDSDAEQAVSAAARAANVLFARYRQNFANMPRISRRPSLLDRLIASLRDVKSWMESIKAEPAQQEMLAKNLTVVSTQLDTWLTERDAIRQVRSDCEFGQLIRAFQVEYDDAVSLYREEFAGKDRVGRDLALLESICSRLDEVERMCRRQLATRDIEELAILIQQARESRFRFCREFDAIREAKKNPGSLDDSLN